MPGVTDILNGRHGAAALGARELAWHSSTFHCEFSLGRATRLQLRLPSELLHDLSVFATALGLKRDKLVIVALALVLLDLPLTAGDHEDLNALLSDFASRVSERAAEVVQRGLHAQARPGRSQPRTTFAEQLACWRKSYKGQQ